MERNSIIVITTGWFPEGDAGAVRLQMMGRVLVENGYRVTVLCRGKLNDKGSFHGVNYISLRNKEGGFVAKAIDYSRFPIKVKLHLQNNKNKLFGVYIYNAHDTLFSFCKEFCKKNHIQLFHDCVEWYSPEEYKLGKFDRWYRMKDRINTKIIDHSFSVIAITKYLEEYFSSKGIHSIRVPILCDSETRVEPKSLHEENITTIFYGGLPGTKDLVGNLLEASLLLDESEKKKLRIIIIGAKKDYLIQVSHISGDIIDQCADYVEMCGRVPRSTVLEKMEIADFSFLARDKELRYAKAGFPSKVVEALSNATPMLCNISSDLAEYLVDGENAIIAENHTPEALCHALRRAINMTAAEKQVMSKKALETAKSRFDYRLYRDMLKDFLEASGEA